MAPPPKQRLHNFKYHKVSDFKTIQAHGVFGGMNLRGQLNINFYVDVADLPKTTQAPILGNSFGTEAIPSMPLESTSARELHFGINVDIQLAKQIITWMSGHVADYETKVQEALQNTLNQTQNANNTNK